MSATVHQLHPQPPAVDPSEPDRATDVALVEALRAGDPSAGARLFDLYGAYVERLLLRILGRDDELQDALHDVFTKALTTHAQLRDPAALKPWLSRITAGTARDLIRKRSRRRWLAFRSPFELPDQGQESVQEERELLGRVYRVLDRMKPDERVAFTLRRIEGMSLPEVAAACGISLATAKRRLSRAQGRFRRLAEVEGVLDPKSSTDAGGRLP